MSESTPSTTILVVDDHEAGRYARSHVLRQAGFDVLEAGTAAQALEIVEKVKPRLVVLDVNLPDKSGWEVCRILKEGAETGSVLVLQISATFVTGPDTVRALEAGADGCLTEPVEPPVLVATVRALLRARRAEDALREALDRELESRRQADAANRMKDEFLAMLSHELRSPLGSILNWVSLLRRGGVPEAQTAHALESIERNARLQAKLIGDLLDVSSIIAGKLRLEPATTSLAPIVENALGNVRPTAEAKDIELVWSMDPALGPFIADPHRLQQIVWNLMSNAVKFTEPGGRVELRVGVEDDHIEIEVRDNGRGIAPEFLPYIFERFRQEDSSTTRSEGGLGLGLAIVRHLVELHGGTVDARSAGLGHGSTFRARFPCVRPGGAALAPETTRGVIGLAGVRVLVVEDEPDARETLALTLGSAGAHVVTAADAAAAIDAVGADQFDVMISDIGMPGEDGYSLIRRMRERSGSGSGSRPRALALTAYASADDRRRVLDAGFDAYLTKPVDASDLTATIARIIGLPAALRS